MDIVCKEGSLPNYQPVPCPPTLGQCILDFGGVFQGKRKTLQLTIANTTKQPMIWLAHTGEAKWLLLEPDHGILQPGEQHSIRVTVDTRFLASGEHAVTLTFSSEGDETSMSRNMPSKVKVEEPSMSQTPPTPLSLAMGLHLGRLTPQSTDSMGLVIHNPDTRAIDWKIQVGTGAPGMGTKVHFADLADPTSSSQDFAIEGGIIVTPSSGSLQAGKSTTVYVTANASSPSLLPDHAYTTSLSLSSTPQGTTEPVSPPVQIPVTFDVSVQPYNDGGPKTPAGLPPRINFTIPSQQSSGTYSLSFTNNPENANYRESNGVASNGMVDWTLTSPDTPPIPAWLVPDVASGTFTPGQAATIKFKALSNSLPKGNYTTNIYITFTWDASAHLVGMAYTSSIPVSLTIE